ncbi:BTAD domain-containing putative transcriptional regulator [Deinococcus apachensis]|uniref:BTAD domain-containing putative transcriptional regulator n=1 Tax=Deinococcus apachensis TaxID=309886 RepID=UPI000362A0CE|nr:BTAD domain-containing putative transcriptional regulator [Deinococcus apachensis]
MNQLQMFLLGVPRVRLNGQPVHLRTRKMLALLAYLVVEAGPHSRDELSEMLWPGSQTSARAALRLALYHIHAVLGRDIGLSVMLDRVELTRHAGLWADVLELGEREEPPRSEVLELWRGDFLQGLTLTASPSWSEWVNARALHFAERFSVLLARLTRYQLESGQLEGAITTAQRWVRHDPLSEDAYRQLTWALRAAGRNAEAVKTEQRGREVLRHELGVEPEMPPHALTGQLAQSAGSTPRLFHSELPLSMLRPPRLVGREDVWAQMEEAWGRGQVIHIVGDPGEGKSRLALDFAQVHGRVLAFENCPGDCHVPYSSVTRHIRTILRSYPTLSLEPWMRVALAPLLPELTPKGWEETTTVQPAHLTTPLLTALQYVYGFALREVEVVIVDDLQFSDPASLQVGHVVSSSVFPVGQPEGLPYIITCFRRGELPPEGEAMIEQQVAAGMAIRIELEPLNEAAVKTFVASLGVPDLGARFNALRAFTGGNPQMLLETVRHLVETRGIEDGQFSLPPRVQEVLTRRTGRLSRRALQAARAAAVLQHDFTLELVAEMLQAPILDVAEGWAELEAAQMMEGERFSHDLMAEFLARETPVLVRTLLHRAAARTLAAHGGQAARIAEHWRAGGNDAQAAPWLLRAAETARAQGRLSEAATFADQARMLLASQDSVP